MSRVFLDTNLIIYLLEDYGELSVITARFAQRMIERGDTVVTSMMTVGEVMVKPLAIGDQVLLHKYRQLFDAPDVELISFNRMEAMEYAKVRGDKSIKSPDAIQLACASVAKCDLFVTNDDRLSKKVIPGIQFIVSLDRVPI